MLSERPPAKMITSETRSVRSPFCSRIPADGEIELSHAVHERVISLKSYLLRNILPKIYKKDNNVSAEIDMNVVFFCSRW